MPKEQSALRLSPLKISAGYLLFGTIWIPATDILLAVSVDSQQMPSFFGLIKGWLFIGLSTLLIFSLSYVHQQQMLSTQTKLQTANQQLQVFHRVFRHNIRNNLNIVLGYTDLLAEQLSDRRLEPKLETIRQNTTKILEISDKMKVIENVDQTPSNDNTIDLVTLVNTELERVSSANPDVIVCTNVPDHAWIRAGESLQYAIREVLSNAVNHNKKPHSEQKISVKISEKDGAHSLEITDNGPGIPLEELQPLRQENETPLNHASSVGLWLVKWLTSLHGGSVGFETDNGTTVTFTFSSVPIFLLS